MTAAIRPKKDVLPNGLRVVTLELPHLHTATIVLYVKVGSRFETPEESGLSHFVEHMMYRGTDAYPSSYDINFAFESLGGTLHAETGRDYSSYQLTLDPALVPRGIELFEEFFTHPKFSDIDLERQLILEELAEDYDERGVELHGGDIARGLLFEDHPLGHRILGPKANVERFSTDDIQKHFERYYCGKNSLICVAGPVKHEEVVDQAGKHLAGLPPGEAATVTPPSSSQTSPRYKYVVDPGPQCAITALWRSLPESDPDYVASLALLRALDDGMSTPLHYQLCDQLGLAYSVGASLEPLHDVSLLDISGATANAKAGRFLGELLKLCRDFCSREITDADLQRIKVRHRCDHAAIADDALGLAAWYGAAALYAPPPLLEEQIARMEAIRACDIQRAAKRVFTPENLTVVAVGNLTRARQAEVRDALRAFP